MRLEADFDAIAGEGDIESSESESSAAMLNGFDDEPGGGGYDRAFVRPLVSDDRIERRIAEPGVTYHDLVPNKPVSGYRFG